MKATLLYGPRDIRVETVPDPSIQQPSDVIVKVTGTCVCGSDLWPYRGIAAREFPVRIGHEFVGEVVEIGSDVKTLSVGDFVIAPFAISDNTCVNCKNGIHTSCLQAANWGRENASVGFADGGQGELVRVPLADGTLVSTPETPDDSAIPALLALSDVMSTGYHAAIAAGVGPGMTTVVVGDGAVGLSAVLAARYLGAERIIAMSRHADRQAVATLFGATDIVAERGAEGTELVRQLLGGIGADTALECVGTKESMETVIDTVRPGGRVGFVGAPFGPELPYGRIFSNNLTVGGGVAPVRKYLPALLAAVLDGSLDPGPVFDLEVPLDEMARGYQSMDERTAIKAWARP